MVNNVIETRMISVLDNDDKDNYHNFVIKRKVKENKISKFQGDNCSKRLDQHFLTNILQWWKYWDLLAEKLIFVIPQN